MVRTLSPSSIWSLDGRYTPSAEAFVSSMSARRSLYICCLSVKISRSQRLEDSRLIRSESPSLYFCSPLILSDCWVIFLK